jgi:hypothetical protein
MTKNKNAFIAFFKFPIPLPTLPFVRGGEIKIPLPPLIKGALEIPLLAKEGVGGGGGVNNRD